MSNTYNKVRNLIPDGELVHNWLGRPAFLPHGVSLVLAFGASMEVSQLALGGTASLITRV